MVEFRTRQVYDFSENITQIVSGSESELFILDTDSACKKFLLTINNKTALGSQKKLYRTALIKENGIRFAEHVIFEEPSFTIPCRLFAKRYYFLDEELNISYLSPGSTVRGDWGEHKWDNPKVWLHLLKELKDRKMLHKYHDEIEYLFSTWYLMLTLRMLVQKGYEIRTDELQELQETVLKNFPRVNQNIYLNQYRKDGAWNWNDLLLKILNLEICDESVAIVNRLIRQMLGKV